LEGIVAADIQLRAEMDPVLSSTIDFEEYIKGNLSLAGKKAPISSTKPTLHRTSRSNTAPSDGRRTQSDNSGNDLSHDLLKLNLKKYDQTAVTQQYRSYQTGVAGSNAVASPALKIPLQHSWRAHLSNRPGSAAPVYGIPDRKHPNRNEASLHSAGEFISENPLPSPTRYKVSSARVFVRTSDGGESKSLEGDDFGEYRVRLVTLKRLFGTWATNSRQSKRQLARTTRDVLENAIYWPKYGALTWWKHLHRAVSFRKVRSLCYTYLSVQPLGLSYCVTLQDACKRRAIDFLWRNSKVARFCTALCSSCLQLVPLCQMSKRTLLQMRRATRLYALMKCNQFLQRLIKLGEKRRLRRLVSTAHCLCGNLLVVLTTYYSAGTRETHHSA
jgi:hypothetical protein